MFNFLRELAYFCRMIRVVLLGAGNVAQHLYAGFLHQPTIEVIQCYNRKGQPVHPEQPKHQILKNITLLEDADVYILAVSDDAIKEVSSALPFSGRFVVHTSGSAPMHVLDASNHRGVFYPLQTFSKDTPVDFSNVPFCLETERTQDIALLQQLTSVLSPKGYKISSAQRNALHVAAVMVNNFTNHLFSIGNDICRDNDIPFEILHPLISETALKVTKIQPDQAQTGPAKRNDQDTIDRHIQFLSNPTHQEIYQILTKAIQAKYGKKL